MADFDESELYDRQIRLWGVEAQKRIQSSRVLIFGMGGLGAEVAKNLVLAGISATIVDDGACTPEDLASNFFLDVGDVTANRALACLPRIRELNKNVSVEAHASSLASLEDSFLLQHNIILVTRTALSEQVRLDELCRSAPTPTAFYAADVFGYEGLLFVDLGSHTYRTESGSGASKLSDPIVVKYPSLVEASAVPWSALANKRFGPVSPCYAHARILQRFSELNGGSSAQATDAAALLSLGGELSAANGVSSSAGPKVALSFGETEARALAATAQAELSPVCAVLGGVIGQEAVKFVSGKGAPVFNFFALNAMSGEGKMFQSPPK